MYHEVLVVVDKLHIDVVMFGNYGVLVVIDDECR